MINFSVIVVVVVIEAIKIARLSLSFVTHRLSQPLFANRLITFLTSHNIEHIIAICNFIHYIKW